VAAQLLGGFTTARQAAVRAERQKRILVEAARAAGPGLTHGRKIDDRRPEGTQHGPALLVPGP
jgi:hypothetical protein